MIEEIVRGYRPEPDGHPWSESWGRQIDELDTEHLLAIRDQVQRLMEHVAAEREPEHVRAGEVLAAAEALLQRFRRSG